MNSANAADERLFDRLCMLRALYARRGDRDRIACISVADAIRLARVRLAGPGTPTVPAA